MKCNICGRCFLLTEIENYCPKFCAPAFRLNDQNCFASRFFSHHDILYSFDPPQGKSGDDKSPVMIFRHHRAMYQRYIRNRRLSAEWRSENGSSGYRDRYWKPEGIYLHLVFKNCRSDYPDARPPGSCKWSR